MRARLIALAVLMAAAAGLLALLLHRAGPTHAQRPPLTRLAPAAVTRISAAAAGQPDLVLVRRRGRWRLLAPVTAPADQSAVRSLTAELDEPVSASYPATAVDAADAGLAPPALTLEANGIRLDFGALNPATLLRYVRRGDRVLLVMDRIAPMLQSGPWQFVERRLVPRDVSLAAVTLRGDRPAPADIVHAWERAEAERVEPLKHSVNAHALRVRLDFAGGGQADYAVRARRPDLELARPDLGIVYVFDAGAASALLGTAASPPAESRTHARAAGSRNHPPRP